MILEPNEYYRYVMRNGMMGWDVATIQIAFNASAYDPKLVVDGDYGPATEKAAKGIQNLLHIAVDGIVGPETQSKLCIQECNKAEINTVPQGLVKGICLGESGGIIPTTSSVYPNGSRDYGPFQINILYPNQPINQPIIIQVFEPGRQAQRVAITLRKSYEIFLNRIGAKTNEQAWRLAVADYNWPAAAQAIANGESSTWSYIESGTKIRRKLSDNAPWVEQYKVPGVKTGLEWVDFYIDSKIIYVKSWNT